MAAAEDPFPQIRPLIPAPSTSAAPGTSTVVNVPGVSGTLTPVLSQTYTKPTLKAHNSRLTRHEAWEPAQHRIDDQRIDKEVNTSAMAAAVARMSKASLKNLITLATASVESTEPEAENFHVERKIRSILRDWSVLITVWANTEEPEVEFTRELMWQSPYVLKFAPNFLTLRVREIHHLSDFIEYF